MIVKKKSTEHFLYADPWQIAYNPYQLVSKATERRSLIRNMPSAVKDHLKSALQDTVLICHNSYSSLYKMKIRRSHHTDPNYSVLYYQDGLMDLSLYTALSTKRQM